jgi:hypothetical protein
LAVWHKTLVRKAIAAWRRLFNPIDRKFSAAFHRMRRVRTRLSAGMADYFTSDVCP